MDGVVALAKRIQSDTDLAALIRRKFAIKCTTGYSLNALVDFPVRCWAPSYRDHADTLLSCHLSDYPASGKVCLDSWWPAAGHVVMGSDVREFAYKTSNLSFPQSPDDPQTRQVDDPIEIIKRLMIGSEGTLGFVAQATYNTVPEWPHKVWHPFLCSAAPSHSRHPGISRVLQAIAVLCCC